MIDKIRKNLVQKYTLVITIMLLTVFGGCYYMYRHIVYESFHEALTDYLDEEIWEAYEAVKDNHETGDVIHKVKAGVDAVYNFTYWYYDGKLIRAEVPDNDYILEELQRRFQRKTYKENKIYYENIKYQKVKWYFSLMVRSFSVDGRKTGKVYVLSNITPLKWSSKQYVLSSLGIIALLTIFALIAGNILARRSIIPIKYMFDKQKRFVSDASHELRTPLSVLLAYIELLEKQEDAEVFQNMKDEVLSMSRLVAQLLELARSDNNQLCLQYEEFQAADLVTEVVTNMKEVCKSKSITIKCNINDNVLVKADRVMMKQVLYILLENALKYSSIGKIVIINLKKNKKYLYFEIIDEGKGIDEKDLKHIFERFYRAETSRTRNDGGLGLGLSMAEVIVKMHNGNIAVESELNKGSKFTVIIPL